MIKTFTIALIIICSTTFSWGQNTVWHLKNQIEQKAQYLDIDKLSNIYLVSQYILTKYIFSKGKYSKKTYSNSKYGLLEHIDVSNPFRILLFYKEYQTLIILDNNLSLISEISLYDIGIEDARIVCSSKQGGFWIFENTNQNFEHFDSNLKKTKESLSIDLMFKENYTPIYMLEKNKQLYVNTAQNNFFIFDQFANFDKEIPLKIKNKFTLSESINYFCKEMNSIISYQPISLETKEIDLSWQKNILDARIEQKKLYIFTPKGISVFEQ